MTPFRTNWLTLDPTPVALGTSASDSFSWSDLWDTTTTSLRNVWRTVFIETQRNPIYDEVGDWMSSLSSDQNPNNEPGQPEPTSLLNSWLLAGLLAPVAVIASLLLVWWATRRRKAKDNRSSNGASGPEMVLYHRWLALASRKLGLVPESSQTPLEFADLAGLRASATTAVGSVGRPAGLIRTALLPCPLRRAATFLF